MFSAQGRFEFCVLNQYHVCRKHHGLATDILNLAVFGSGLCPRLLQQISEIGIVLERNTNRQGTHRFFGILGSSSARSHENSTGNDYSQWLPRTGCIPNHTIKKGVRDLRDQQPLGIGQKPPKNQICFASGNRNIYIYVWYCIYTWSILWDPPWWACHGSHLACCWQSGWVMGLYT